MNVRHFLRTASIAALIVGAPSLAHAVSYTNFSATPTNINGATPKNLAVPATLAIGTTVVVTITEDDTIDTFAGTMPITDTQGNAYVLDATCNQGGYESLVAIGHSVLTHQLTTADHLIYTAIGSNHPYGNFNAGYSPDILAVDGTGACTSYASGATTTASGNNTSAVSGIVVGAAIAKSSGATFTQPGSWTAAPASAWGSYGPVVSAYQIYSGVQTLNYNPTSTAQPGSSTSAEVLYRTAALPFNAASGGLMNSGPAINSTQNDGCNQAPAPAAAAGLCLQTWSTRPGEWNTPQTVDKPVAYPSGDKIYFDDCNGQNGTTGATNTTLNTAASATYGDNSGGFQANFASATCHPNASGNNFVGTAFGGAAYYEVTTSFTASSGSSDWEAMLWLWPIECNTVPVMPACNWTGQQTNYAITSASYVSSTGVLTVTPSVSTTIAQYYSAILTSLTGTGNYAALNGATCYSPNAVSGSGTYTLNCTAGLGTLALTGGNIGQVYYHLVEIDNEMFLGNFSDSLNDWQRTDHDWAGLTKGTNYSQYVIYSPGQASFSSPHKYGILYMPATASTQGYIATYYDGSLLGTRYFSQFINNGVQVPPASGQPWAFGADDNLHIVVFSGCATGTNPCTTPLIQVWQANANNNIHQ